MSFFDMIVRPKKTMMIDIPQETPEMPETMSEWMRIGDDMIDTIISYLPIDVRRRLTRASYIAHLDLFMTKYNTLPLHDGKGLFPRMLLASSFPQRRVSTDSTTYTSVNSSRAYGDDVDIFIELMRKHMPGNIDYLPDNISQHPAAKDVFMSYLCFGGARITCSLAMKTIVTMLPARHIEEVYFCISDVRNMLEKFPEMSGYTFNCFNTDGEGVSASLDYDAVPRKFRPLHTINDVERLATTRGMRRALEIIVEKYDKVRLQRDELIREKFMNSLR